jgi:hypothetical protein
MSEEFFKEVGIRRCIVHIPSCKNKEDGNQVEFHFKIVCG